MLVPDLISSPVFQRGTVEYACPGATTSGFAVAPPRELHHPIRSGGGAPACGDRVNAPGSSAPTDRARSADPGNSTVEMPGPSLPAADRHDDVGMGEQEGVDQRIDRRPPRPLVADIEAEVQHQREAALGGEPDGVVHRASHAPGHGHRPARVVGDLEAQQLGAGRHAVEAGDAEHPVTRGDAGDVGAVTVGVEEQIEVGHPGRIGEVGGEGQRLPAERDRLASLPIVVQRLLVLERAVQVRIEEHHPPVARFHDDDGEGIGIRAVAVHVGRRQWTQRQLAKHCRHTSSCRRRAVRPARPRAACARQWPGSHPCRASPAGARRGPLRRSRAGRAPSVRPWS